MAITINFSQNLTIKGYTHKNFLVEKFLLVNVDEKNSKIMEFALVGYVLFIYLFIELLWTLLCKFLFCHYYAL